MKRFLLLALTLFLALPLFALDRHPQADTIGMTISRTYRTIQTTIFVEQTMDSIVSIDPYTGEQRITTVTFDTLIGEETIATLDTTFFITEPLRFWRLESTSSASVNQIARGFWQRDGTGNNLIALDFRNASVANFERGLSTWRTEFNWRYGTQRQAQVGEFFKTNDILSLQSRYGFRASPNLYYSSQFQFETQLTRTFASVTTREESRDNYLSNFLSPARLAFSLGMEYRNTDRSVRLLLSPVTYRTTYVRSPQVSVRERFGVDTISGWLHTFGQMVQLENRHSIRSNITLTSNLMLFLDNLHMNNPASHFLMLDWRLGIDIQLTRYFSLGLEMWTIYDPNTFFDRDRNGVSFNLEDPTDFSVLERRWQFQQSLMFRFTYQIRNF